MKVNIGPFPEPLPDKSGYHEREVEVKIDNYDVWNLDVTLCLIMEPLFKAHREDLMKNPGNPFIDDEDVPENLRDGMPIEAWGSHDYKKYEDRGWAKWLWIIDEIIFATNAINTDWEIKYDTYCCDEYKQEGERIRNGFKLLGKYFQAFWT